MAAKLTPMLQQYMAIKQEHPDVILMCRLGDFYEMFGDDAKIAAQELEITLTSSGRRTRGPDADVRCAVSLGRPLRRAPHQQGVPGRHLRSDGGPELAKGLVKREVTRVVTPGTILEELDAPSREQQLPRRSGAQARRPTASQ